MDALIPPITDLATTRDGHVLHFGEWPGPEPTLVAVHGLANHHRNLAGVAAALDGELRIVAPDLAGRGLSPRPSSGICSLQRHAHDVLDLMDQVGVRQALLAGHSMGAYVATMVAELAPDRVEGLILIDGGVPPEGPSARSDALIAAVEAHLESLATVYPTPSAFLDAVRAQPSYAGQLDEVQLANSLYSLGRVAKGYRRKVDTAAIREDMLAAFETSAAHIARLAALRCPILAVGAEEGIDPGMAPVLGQPEFELLRAVLRDVTAVTVPGTDHHTITISLQGARRCAALISDLVSRLTG